MRAQACGPSNSLSVSMASTKRINLRQFDVAAVSDVGSADEEGTLRRNRILFRSYLHLIGIGTAISASSLSAEGHKVGTSLP